MNDIYFEKNYGRLYEEIEGGKCVVFDFQNDLGKVRHMFIKRPIPTKLEGDVLYDLTTPYGYGGPLVTAYEKEGKTQLIDDFIEAFGKYCLEQKIVSELVRFHPVLRNAEDFNAYYDIIFKRNTIQTKLADSDDPILSEYSSSCRRDIKHALKAGVQYKVIQAPDNLVGFKEIYHSTMKRNGADSIYFFDDAYFSECLEYFKENIILVEVSYEGLVIGMGMYFVYEDLIHVHLTGTLQEFHYLSPAYIIQYAMALWGKENNMKLIHHGGGRTGEKDDKLFLFKKKFGRNQELEYFIGQKVWNLQIYRELCEAAGVLEDTEAFPAYRSATSKIKV